MTAITALEVGSVATLATGVGLKIAELLLSLSSYGEQKAQKVLEIKTKKHDKITTLAKSKLDSVSSLISKAIKDAYVSHQECQFILKEVEHYHKMKEEIRTKYKKAVDIVTAEEREEILKQGREEGKQAFLAKVAATSDTPTVNVI